MSWTGLYPRLYLFLRGFTFATLSQCWNFSWSKKINSNALGSGSAGYSDLALAGHVDGGKELCLGLRWADAGRVRAGVMPSR